MVCERVLRGEQSLLFWKWLKYLNRLFIAFFNFLKYWVELLVMDVSRLVLFKIGYWVDPDSKIRVPAFLDT